jgi:nitrite reductase (NO-forming)/hydroxylamine reductase
MFTRDHSPLLRTSFAVVFAVFALQGCKSKSGEAGKEDANEKNAPTSAQGAPAGSPAQIAAGDKIFNTQCIACHTIGGGKRVGPDLAGVHERRQPNWLKKWIKDPIGMAQNDPIGKEIFAEWNNMPMPNPNLNDGQVDEVLAYLNDASAKAKAAPAPAQAEGPRKLSDTEYTSAKQIYFDRCSGCHGTLRAGATGPALLPKRTAEIGTDGLKAILTHGTPGGMPAWGRLGLLNDSEIEVVSNFLQVEPPQPPPLELPAIKASWELKVPVASRPTKPETKRNWRNYFGVILRDAGKVAIVDGDTKEKVAIFNTGFAVHILRSSFSGRYFYSVGRDGRVTMIDLWPETPQLVATVRGCMDARSVDSSKFKGYEDKFLIEGCYWPSQYVVYDGQTLEPLTVQSVIGPAFDSGEDLKEVRVASIIASHFNPIWVVSLKESGHVAIVDYSKPNFPMTAKIGAERFLHDGGWDKTKRYFMVAANMRNKMAVIDVKKKELVTTFETGTKPHPGRGANWLDPEFGWVNGTTHIGEAKLTVYGADPAKHPEHAWKVVREIPLDSPGGLFLKTHDKSPWVWVDMPLSNVDEKTRQICVYSKKEGKIHKCWTPFAAGRGVHFEYNADGTEVWVSGWDKNGALAVYNDAKLEEVARVQGDWLENPTGKFNVYNTAQDVY